SQRRACPGLRRPALAPVVVLRAATGARPVAVELAASRRGHLRLATAADTPRPGSPIRADLASADCGHPLRRRLQAGGLLGAGLPRRGLVPGLRAGTLGSGAGPAIVAA